MTVEIDFQVCGAYCTYTGQSGLTELRSTIECLISRPEFDTYSYVVHDCLDANADELDDSALVMVAAQRLGMKYINRHVKSALITSDSRIVEALERYTTLTKREVCIFEAREQALVWIAHVVSS